MGIMTKIINWRKFFKFDEAKIDYYIVGENFINIYPLIQPAKFYVINKQVDEVKELLKDFEFHILGLSTREDDEEKEK